MATIGTRINENGEEEIIITDINNDLNGLIDAINEIREREPFGVKIFITERLIVRKQNVDEDINFSNCIFEKIVSFKEIAFNEITSFSGSIFQDDTEFAKVFFQRHTDFREAIFQGNIEFDYVKYAKDVDFNKVNFQEKVYFIDVEFQDEVDFYAAIFQNTTNFLGTNFQEKVYFDNVVFEQNIYFERVIFNNFVRFEYAIFNKIVSFSFSTFQSPQTFYSTNFMDTANFSNTTFEQEAKFTDCKVDSKTLISFQCAIFKKGLDISTSNFNLCKLNFLGIRIENINEALSSAFYDEKRDDTKPFLSIHQRLRETFRFIKNSLYAENNQIEGLEFHKKEMEVYEKELESKGDEYWQEKIILWFNKMSNHYGTSWLRGVGFTAVWALGILGIILGITTLENSGIVFNLCDVDAWKHTIKAYIEIINIAKWTDIKPLGYELSGFGLFFLFVGRIFIGYGYYQTIQAFRKYGK